MRAVDKLLAMREEDAIGGDHEPLRPGRDEVRTVASSKFVSSASTTSSVSPRDRACACTVEAHGESVSTWAWRATPILPLSAGAGDRLPEQLEPFAVDVEVHGRKARDVAAGARQALRRPRPIGSGWTMVMIGIDEVACLAARLSRVRSTTMMLTGGAPDRRRNPGSALSRHAGEERFVESDVRLRRHRPARASARESPRKSRNPLRWLRSERGPRRRPTSRPVADGAATASPPSQPRRRRR